MGSPIRFTLDDIDQPSPAGVMRFSLDEIEPENRPAVPRGMPNIPLPPPAPLPEPHAELMPAHQPPALPSLNDILEGTPAERPRIPVAPLPSHEAVEPIVPSSGEQLLRALIGERASSLVGQGVRSFTQGFVGTPAEGLAATGQWFGFVDPEVLKNVQASNAHAFREVEQFGSVLDDPKGTLGNPAWWARAGGQVAGSVASLMTAGTLGGKPAAVVGESWLEGATAYSDAIKRGATPMQAGLVAAGVVAVNLPFLAVTNTPIFDAPTKSALLNVVLRSVVEGGQEAGQGAITNAAARAGYDPNQEVFTKDLLDEAIVGGIVGPLAGAGVDRLTRPSLPVTPRARTQADPPSWPDDGAGEQDRRAPIPELEAQTRAAIEREAAAAAAAAIAPEPVVFRPEEIDTPAPAAQTIADESAQPEVGERAGEEGFDTLSGVAQSLPTGRESARQTEARRQQHNADVFGHVLTKAREVDPAVDETDLRAEFDYRLSVLEELDHEYRESGHNPRLLLEQIAKSGGISLDAEKNGGLSGELRWLRESAAGPYGNFAGVPNVFRTKSNDKVSGKRMTGLGLDDMQRRLSEYPEFSHIESIQDLLDALSDIARLGDVGARGAAFPGTKELYTRANMKGEQPWWTDSWRAPVEDVVETSETDEADLDADTTTFNVDEIEAPVAEPPGKPSYRPGDIVAFKGSQNGEAEVREVFYVKDKKKGDRWRVRVVFPQKRDGEIGPAGAIVESNRDLTDLQFLRAAQSEASDEGIGDEPITFDVDEIEGRGPKSMALPRNKRSQGTDLFAAGESDTDTLDTGEHQPRLPVVGKVREQDVETPEFDAPFSLTPETDRSKKGKQTTLFDSKAKEVSTGLTKSLPARKPGQPTIPLTGRMRHTEILKNLQRVLGNVPTRTGHFNQQAYGIYKTDVRAIRLKVANNLQTFFHEEGHHVDFAILGIDRKDARWQQELIDLGQATSRPSYTKTEQRQEGAAEFLRLWLTEPATVKSRAPNYTAEFERRLNDHPELRDGLLEVREDIQGLISQDPATRGRLRIDRRTARERKREALREAARDPHAVIRKVASVTIDDLHPLRAAVEQMRDGRDLEYRMNAYVLARVARGSAGKAEAFLEHGVRGRNGKFIGPSLADALEPVRDHLDVFGDYLVALRAAELHNRGIEPGMAKDEAQGIITETEARSDFQAFEQARDAVYSHQDAILEYARLYGAMSKGQLKAIKQLNRAYVPMQRVLDATEESLRGVAKRIANRELPVKRIRGSGRDIINPLESMVKNAFAIVDMVEKNRAMQALVRQAESSAGSARWIEAIPTPKVATRFNLSELTKDVRAALVNNGAVDPDALPFNLDEALDALVTVWTPATFAKGNEQIVTVLRNGVRQFWQVNDDALYQALTMMGPRTTSRLMQLFNKPTKLLRAAATLTPGFILRNPGRDTLVAYMQSRYGFIPVYDTLKGLISQVRGDEDAKLFYTSGIAQAAMAAQHRDQRQTAVKQVTKAGGLRGVPLNPIELLRAFSQWTETATRLGEFKLALDAGGVERGVWRRLLSTGQRAPVSEESITKATMAARDVTTDFSRAGDLAREVNEFKAFFNAAVQGKVRMIETIARDPGGTALKAATIALFSAAVWALNEDDEEYQEKEAWEKSSYWFVPFPGGGVTINGYEVKWLKIPKPFDWGYAADITEAALDYMRQGDATRFREMKEQLVGTNPAQLIPALLPTGILPLVEVWANYSAFRDTHIVQPWDLDLETDLQYSEWTSTVAKQLGQVIPVAPAHIDHLIFGFTAGFGRGVVSGIDTAQGLLGIVPRRDMPAGHVQQLPIAGTFLSDGSFGSGAQSLQDLYDLADALEKVERSVAEDLKQGNRASAVERTERAEARLPIAWGERGRITAARQSLKDLAPRIRQIYAAPASEVTPEQKREQLDAVRAQMVSIARRALGKSALPERQAR